MSLAIRTTTGQQHESRGRQLLDAFARYTHSSVLVTDPAAPAALDAVFCRDGVVVAVAEAKTRVSYDYAAIQRFGSYLVTAEKIDTLCYVGRALAVPAFLVVELSDGARLYWQLTDKDGDQRFLWPEAETRTQATSLGPVTVVRKNAYLPLDEAVVWGGLDK
jgi:hypothetical protein